MMHGHRNIKLLYKCLVLSMIVLRDGQYGDQTGLHGAG